MNNESFLIDNSDLEVSQVVCSNLVNTGFKNRAYANVLAAQLAKKYFLDIDVDIDSGLYKIPQIIEKYDISDVYINDAYIDVRLYINPEEIYIPKSHFASGNMPVAYMFIKLSEGLTNGEVTGFITSENLIDVNITENGYKVSEDDLVSFYEVQPLLNNFDSLELSDELRIKLIDFLDNEISDSEAFMGTLLHSKELRLELQKVSKVQTMFNYVSINNSSIENSENNIEKDFSDENQLVQEDSTIEFDLDTVDDLALDSNENLEISIAENEVIEDFESINDNDALIEEDLIENISNNVDIIEDFANERSDLEADISSSVNQDNTNISDHQYENIDEPSVDSDMIIAESETLSVEDSQLPSDEDAELDSLLSNTDAEYKTNTTPSISDIESNSIIEEDANLELNKNNANFEAENNDEISVNQENLNNDSEQQLEALFGNDNNFDDENNVVNPKKRSLFPVFIVSVLLLGAGYLGYNRIISSGLLTKKPNETSKIQKSVSQNKIQQTNNSQKAIPMPNETMENVKPKEVAIEEASTIVPVIEKNFTDSIDVTKLTINWEVPSNYISNTSVKRYFTRIGKIIQLNLKTDLMLTSKSPLTNKISLELEFDKTTEKFKFKKFIISSGEKAVDSVVEDVVKSTLNTNIKTNMSIFNNIKGNPVLVINF